MQHDELIWQCLNHNFCAYKAKVEHTTFCRNPYNVTGLCTRKSCPLSNSSYATIREKKGKIYLLIKTAERFHTPRYMWEKIKLPLKFSEATKILSEKLKYMPRWVVQKNKQRLLRVCQYLIKLRRMMINDEMPEFERYHKKSERRLDRREQKAEAAAQIETNIEKELLERLKKGYYPQEIFNFPLKSYQKAINKLKPKKDVDRDIEAQEKGIEYVEGDDEDFEDFDVGEAELEREQELEREYEYEYEGEGGGVSGRRKVTAKNKGKQVSTKEPDNIEPDENADEDFEHAMESLDKDIEDVDPVEYSDDDELAGVEFSDDEDYSYYDDEKIQADSSKRKQSSSTASTSSSSTKEKEDKSKAAVQPPRKRRHVAIALEAEKPKATSK